MTLFYAPKDPLEVITLSVNWSNVLEQGEHIESATWTITNTTTPTEDTSAMRINVTDISGDPVVRQKVKDGTDGCEYLHRCTIVTSTGRTLVQGVVQVVKVGA